MFKSYVYFFSLVLSLIFSRTSEAFSQSKTKQEKIVDEIQYAREIAGFPNWPNLFGKIETYLNDFPRMKDLVDLKEFPGKTGWNNSSKDIVGFIAENPYNGDYIISIRGTMTLQIDDWITNFNVNQRACDHLSCFCKENDESHQWQENIDIIKVELSEKETRSKKTHDGFYCYARSMLDPILTELFKRFQAKFKNSGEENFYQFLQKVKISFYGHSLGGAAAQILAMMIKNELLYQIEILSKEELNIEEIAEKMKGNIKVFTYEAPKVFTLGLARGFDDFIGKENHMRMIQKTRRHPEYGHPVMNTILDLIKEDDFPWENEEWIFDPITEFPFGDYAHTGILWEIVVETPEDHDKAGSFLHTSIPKITLKHIQESMKKNLQDNSEN